ncbi:MAG TPA: sigma 54-interacting transcriptional regulator [Phycisphaerales bacterium]|nr:sigma 54-interacting transcriptional regulator [Phycisphaerales bacterium]
MGTNPTTNGDVCSERVPKSEAVVHREDSESVERIDVAVRAARSSCTILVTGETGVGKGRLAKWLHSQSPRHSGPFVPVNCAAIPESIIDSQLFGHAKGAFTGATREHMGLVRAADGGTLFLDEVVELPMSAQARLLRLLQEREIQPVGHSTPVQVDIRVIAATNIDPQEAVQSKQFRQDLLFRLDVIRLNVPPLRDRLHELEGLLEQFNDEFADLYQQPALQFAPEAMDLMYRCNWPGNVRQLRTVIERLHVLCVGEQISAEQVKTIGQIQPVSEDDEREKFERLKSDHVQKVLAESGGSVAHAAAVFGVHRSTLYRWLRSHR